MPVEFTDVKGDVGDLVVLAPGQDSAQMRQLLGDGTNDADRHRTIVGVAVWDFAERISSARGPDA
ncbi:MAG: hypothetical protein ACLPXZ_06710 [Mycobacterium sp.]